MGRRRNAGWNTTHIDSGKTRDYEWSTGKKTTYTIALCGYEQTLKDDAVVEGAHVESLRYATAERPVNCAGCKAKLAEQAVRKLDKSKLAFGEMIKDKAWLKHTYRSIRELKFNGKLIGFATCENGWGKGWDIREVEDDGSMGEKVGGRYRSATYNSKEEALLAVPQLVADGKLYTKDEAAEAVKLRRAADERARAEQEAKAKADHEEKERRYQVLVGAAQKLHGEERVILDQACYALFYRRLPKELVST